MFWKSKLKQEVELLENSWVKFSDAVKNLLSAPSEDKKMRAILGGIMSLTGSTRGLLIPVDEDTDESIVFVGIGDDEAKNLLRLSMSADVSGEMSSGKEKWYFYPIVHKDSRIGLVIADNNSFQSFNFSNLSIFLFICGLSLSYSRLKDISLKDSLTGLHTRAFFEEQLYSAIRRARRLGIPFGLIMIDIDNFKQVNSDFGHPVGDEVLRRVSSELRGSVKDIDNVGRLGGEEFGIVVDDADEEITLAVAERLCSEVAKLDVSSLIKRNITISAGVSIFRKGLLAKGLITMSDIALRQAKREGKNRVVVYKINEERVK